MTLSDKTLSELRAAGCVVVVYTPEEIGDADPLRVEDRLVDLGNQIIQDLGGGEHQCHHECGDQ